MKVIFSFIAILFLSLNVLSEEMCVSLFKGEARDLGKVLGSQNADQDLQIFNEQMQKILSQYEDATKAENPKVREAVKAIKDAAFVEGLWARMIGQTRINVHAAQIEKMAEALVKLNMMFDGDLFHNELKENKKIILAARKKLVEVGIRRFLEQQGVRITEHYQFSIGWGSIKTLWYDGLKPVVKFFLFMNPTRRSSLTEEQAIEILWKGANSPTALKWQTQDEVTNFKERWNIFSEKYPRFVFRMAMWTSVAVLLVGGGMVYKSYERSQAESLYEFVQRQESLDALKNMVAQDTPNALLHDTLDIYRENHDGAEPPAEFVARTKAQILKHFPNAKFTD